MGIPVHYMNARHVIEIFMPFDSGSTLYGCTLVVPPGSDRRVDSKPTLGARAPMQWHRLAEPSQ